MKDLQTTFRVGGNKFVRAVDGVSFDLDPGETVAIVGESGSGKSVTSLSIMGLLPHDSGEVTSGSMRLDGQELRDLNPEAMRRIRGKKISMIFQEPMTSLNPVHTIGRQISEVVIHHEGLSHRAARARAIEMLELVGIPEPTRRVDNYPHQMSGGMRQRAMIAMALSCEPAVLIADEPTTALDVTIQAQMLELMQDLQDRMGMAIIFITHDLGVVAEVADRVVVMYAGEVVESGTVHQIFEAPRMPYTVGLMNSIPRLGTKLPGNRLQTIRGTVPPLSNLPRGCRFHPRCDHATDVCRGTGNHPSLDAAAPGHLVRCARWKDIRFDVEESA
ncbi:ABC transporter ATP-binding protein [Palleronia abyssalis]|uniref:ABC transporter ATP-binding protein n=1 Tax=Palleronia abyssalis TaxID=1501240 RepID=UPI001FE9E7E8|nr:ABC transporter ATP-binding protein [Palleronia abyssalis]